MSQKTTFFYLFTYTDKKSYDCLRESKKDKKKNQEKLPILDKKLQRPNDKTEIFFTNI